MRQSCRRGTPLRPSRLRYLGRRGKRTRLDHLGDLQRSDRTARLGPVEVIPLIRGTHEPTSVHNR